MSASPANIQVSARQVPWMKIGALTDDVLTTEEAVKQGGLDFTVSFRAQQFATKEGGWKPTPKRYALVRDDNEEYFETTSETYSIFQYTEAFTFMDGIGARYVAAGSLKGGRQGFVVGLLNDVNLSELDTLDPHTLFVVLRASHNKTRAIEVAMMPLRGKCMNQLTMHNMLMSADQRWAVPHIGNVKKKIEIAFETISLSNMYAKAYVESVQRLADISLSTSQGRQILTKVIRKSPKQEEAVEKIVDMWQHDETIGFTDKGWGLVNAVSSYFDWERQGGTPESRFLGALSGQTRNAIERTSNLVLRTK